MEQENYAVNGLEDKFELLKKEVDSLQVVVMSRQAPWYKNVSILISAIALIFSFGTTYVSFQRTKIQDIQNLRVELRGLVQRLTTLPKDNYEIMQKYKEDPSSMNLYSGFITQETALLARQAAEITLKLPPDYVSGTEYYTIAMALQNCYKNEEAAEFFKKAIDSSDGFSDKIAALRGLAGLQFLSGETSSGRESFQKALDIFSEFKGYSLDTQVSTNVATELMWSQWEASTGHRDQAIKHHEQAEYRLKKLTSGTLAKSLSKQIENNLIGLQPLINSTSNQ